MFYHYVRSHRVKSVKGRYDNASFPQNPLPSLCVPCPRTQSCSDFLPISKVLFPHLTSKFNTPVNRGGASLVFHHFRIIFKKYTAPPRRLMATSKLSRFLCALVVDSVTSPSSQTELWPAAFYVQHINQRPLLREIHDWVKTHTVPMCMFMPDRLPHSTASKANEDAFKQFADHLMRTQSVS